MSHKFHVKISVNAPKEASWALIADYGRVDKYVRGVLNSHLTTENTPKGIGCTRHCDLPKMMMMKQYIVEEITDWKEGESLNYKVTETNAPIRDGKVKWWVTGDDSSSEIHAEAYYQPKGIMGFLMTPMLKVKFPQQLNDGLTDMKTYIESNSAHN